MKGETLSWKLDMASEKVKNEDESKKLIPAASIEINVVKFLESRNREMEAMRESAALVSTNARVMQQLPRHMRRRAASHNVKRLPRELRLQAEREMKKSGGMAVTKRPSRRHRRRPRCLLQDYERRKRKHVWLETHIWHAKRFRMAELWGYKIPLSPNDRGIRAAYRDAANKCLLFDLSYYCCIEICGSRETLLSALSRLTSPEIAPTFGSQKFARGTKEGQTVLYRHDSYPFGALGEVRFLWKACPNSSETETSRSLWIWTHPSSYQVILSELEKVFPEAVSAGDDREVVSNSVAISSLKDKLCRFRLVGPRSQEIVRRVFQTANFSDLAESQNDSSWWNLEKNSDKRSVFEQQATAWKRMESFQSPSDLLPNSVYGLVVRDPRVTGQLKKETAIESRCLKQQAGVLDPCISVSPIWDRDVRELVKDSMLKTSEINHLKSNNLVPGSALDLGSRESRIPILFIQNPGASTSLSSAADTKSLSRLGFGCGWDVILPAGWSLPFWIALCHCEAHPVGLEELSHLSFEQSELFFPDHFPDTPSGADVNLSTYVKNSEKYGRIPPAKRINYRKLKVEAPFHFPWLDLVNGWRSAEFSNATDRTDDFCCLRNRNILQFLQKLVIDSTGQINKRQIPTNAATLKAASLKLETIVHDPYLVPVHVTMCSRGAAGKFSMICIPEDSDFAQYVKSPNKPGLVNECRTKKTKIATKSNKRKHEETNAATPMKKKGKFETDDTFASSSYDNKTLESNKSEASSNIMEHSTMQLEQILPDKINEDAKKSLPVIADVVNSSSKQIFGYVISESGLAYTKGRGSSLGFVSLRGLLSLIEKQKVYVRKNMSGEGRKAKYGNSITGGVVVLVRSTRCEHYRFAKLNILQKI